MTEKEEATREMAEADFDRMLKAARTNWEKYCRKNGEESANNDKEDIIEAIEAGQISIGESGFPTFYPETDDEDVEKFVFHRRILGTDVAAASRAKTDDDRFYQAAGQYFKIAPPKIRSLEFGDIAMLQLLWVIFLRV